MQFTEEFQRNFKRLTTSLKLAQRAELLDSNDKDVLKRLYVDPLPYDAVLNQILSDETTFIVGRKGTGKSTIFAMAQDNIRSDKNIISAYIDVKSLYGKSISQDIEIDKYNEVKDKLIILQHFIYNMLNEIIKEIKDNLNKKNIFCKLFVEKDFNNAINQLESLAQDLQKTDFTDVSLLLEVDKDLKQCNEQNINNVNNVSLASSIEKDSIKLDGNVSASKESSYKNSDEELQKYSSVLLRHFSIIEYLEKLKKILSDIGFKKVFIFLDDFSEIDIEAQTLFVNIILAPLNNWSDKYYRLKVAAYPKRIYYGDIDKTKIDEIYLDYYALYKVKDLTDLENKAIDFLERLLNKRFEYYLGIEPYEIFKIDSNNNWDDYKELLFHASMNIPRVLGHILNYCYESSLIYKRKITKSLVEEAAMKYYQNKVLFYFDKKDKVLEAFDERLDRYGQELLKDSIKKNAKKLKNELVNEDTSLFKELTNPPTSHFYVIKENFEKYLHTLELNYVINKYYEQSDRDGKTVSIYALNLGLCKQENIKFGRPKGDSKYRKYYISRHFNYSSLLENHLKNYKKYVCSECNTEYNYEEFEIIKKIDMLCYKGCKQKSNIEEKYFLENMDIAPEIDEAMLLPELELDILKTIGDNPNEDLYASQIAKILDCTYQLIGHRAKKLLKKRLIYHDKKFVDGSNRTIYRLTEVACASYL